MNTTDENTTRRETEPRLWLGGEDPSKKWHDGTNRKEWFRDGHPVSPEKPDPEDNT